MNALPFDYPCEKDMWDILKEEIRPIVVYGMGNGADKLFRRFEKYGIEVSDVFASDGFVRGHYYREYRVLSFSEIKDKYSDFVIVLSFASNRAEVLEMLLDINSHFDLIIPDMPVAGEDEYFDREFFNNHYDEITEAYNSLSDQLSKSIFSNIVKYKLSGKMEYLLSAVSSKEDKYSLLLNRPVRSFVDVGAYNGDTLREAVEIFDSLEQVYAIEPDAKNFKKLKKSAENIGHIDIKLINAAAWCSNCTGNFSLSGNRNSTVSATASYENKNVEIQMISIDSVVDTRIDYIKYDVEGAEFEALVGSEETISRYRPMLLVSLYHRSKDIFFLINTLRKKYSDYSFFVRRIPCVPAWEIELIMIPD